jgi:alpha-glucosidase
MKKVFFAGFLLIALSLSFGVELKSPDGKINVTFDVKDFEGNQNCLIYKISYKNKPIIIDSRLGFNLLQQPGLLNNFEVFDVVTSKQDTVWNTVYGEREKVRDNFREMVVNLKETNKPFRQLNLIFRAYDEGIAFCYEIPKQVGLDKITISKEITEFRFSKNHTTWTTYRAQDPYEKVNLTDVKNGCERPLTIQMESGLFISLAEARLVDYARMKFDPLKDHPFSLVSSLSSQVKANLPLKTPWRVVMIADSPAELLQNKNIILNLNDACQIKDPSWIKPGKVLREVSYTTEGGLACVDFAAKHNIEYIEYDAGWYGAEKEDSSDATTITVDPVRSAGNIDLFKVIKYAKERGVEMLVYVNRVALEKQLDEILPLYQQWGIKGVKYGFVQVGSQKWTTWLHEAVRKAAQYQLMVDVHDEYRPTGYSRTYPNFMTQEGIRGDEESTNAEINLITLFTRMLAGAGDNTVCYFDPRVDRVWSHAYQLAKSVIFYSPLQFIYWYDRPKESPLKGGAGGKAPVIEEVPELEFFDNLPTVWDDTKVLNGEIGEYATITRRSGKNWFVATMNANEERTIKIVLSFLNPGQKFAAHIYSDDPKVNTSTKVRIEHFLVDSTTTIIADLGKQNGQAIRIVPANKKDLIQFKFYQ